MISPKLAEKPHFVVVHNLPSPYRLHLFNKLNEHLERDGWRLTVHFMDGLEAQAQERRVHRPNGYESLMLKWNTSISSNAKFAYKFWKVIRLPFTRGQFNPALLFELFARKPAVVMYGGVWTAPTCAIGIGLLGGSKKVGWYEANSIIPGRTDFIARMIKRWLLRRLDWHALPGLRAVEFTKSLLGGEKPIPISYLPNIVDETRFIGSVFTSIDERNEYRNRLKVPTEKRLILTPARLSSEKGLEDYLSTIAEARLANLHFMILGDGPLKARLEEMREKLNLESVLTIVPFVNYEEMPKIYAMSDIFCLPSVIDPNPLSVVEAMHSKLPVLLSDRLGNYPEALIEGRNGFGFSPGKREELRRALELMARIEDSEIIVMGKESKSLAEQRFCSDLCIKKFLKLILESCPRTGGADSQRD